MTLADVSLSPYEIHDIFDTFKTVPLGAFGFAAIGAFCGWLLAAGVEKLSAGVAIIVGIAVAVALTGFNDPQLGIQQPAKPCSQLPGGCFHLTTTATGPAGGGSAP